MADDPMAKASLDDIRKLALKRFKISGKGLTVVMQKGKVGHQFKFRPVRYDMSTDTIILHQGSITEAVKKRKVPAKALLRYVMFFGVGLAAEVRRMSTSGVCPMFNFVDPDSRRKWYKARWTRLEEVANSHSEQLLEFVVDGYMFKADLGNPIPVNELISYLKRLRKQDPSKCTKELQDNIMSYIARSRLAHDTVKDADRAREILERYARSASGPKQWFEINRAIKKLKFGNPENYRLGYPAVAKAMFPGIEVKAHETTLAGLPESERIPKVWKGDTCTYFEWRLKDK